MLAGGRGQGGAWAPPCREIGASGGGCVGLAARLRDDKEAGHSKNYVSVRVPGDMQFLRLNMTRQEDGEVHHLPQERDAGQQRRRKSRGTRRDEGHYR